MLSVDSVGEAWIGLGLNIKKSFVFTELFFIDSHAYIEGESVVGQILNGL